MTRQDWRYQYAQIRAGHYCNDSLINHLMASPRDPLYYRSIYGRQINPWVNKAIARQAKRLHWRFLP